MTGADRTPVEVDLDDLDDRPPQERPSRPRPRAAVVAVIATVALIAVTVAVVGRLADRAERSSVLLPRLPSSVQQQWSTTLDAPEALRVAGTAETVVVATGWKRGLIGLDRRSGVPRWDVPLPDGSLIDLQTVDDVVVVIISAAASTTTTIGFDARTGAELWSRGFADSGSAQVVPAGVLLQLAPSGGPVTTVELLDPRTGEIARTVTGNEIRVAPAGLLRRRGDLIDALSADSFTVVDTLDTADLPSSVELGAIVHTDVGFVVPGPSGATLVDDGDVTSVIELEPVASTWYLGAGDSSGRFVLAQGSDVFSMLSVTDEGLQLRWTHPGWIAGVALDDDRPVALMQTMSDDEGDAEPRTMIDLVDAVSGAVLWTLEGDAESFVDLGRGGLVAAVFDSSDGGDRRLSADAVDLEGRPLWRLPTEPYDDVHLIEGAIVTTRTDVGSATVVVSLHA